MRLSIVCPCYNEEKGLPAFTRGLIEMLKGQSLEKWKIVFVDDGSADGTWKVLKEIKQAHPNCDIIKLSRNFGHQAAICAGLDYVGNASDWKDTDTVIIMDSDGQHPPGLIPELLRARREGYHHVQMVRQDQNGSFFKRITSRTFYRVLNGLSRIQVPLGASDFRAFSGRFLKEYLRLTETVKFNRGLFYWLGFETKLIPYRPDLRIAGETSYTFGRMLRLAVNGITYFSSAPLVFINVFATAFGVLICGGYVLYELVRFMSGVSFSPGWFTIIFAISLWGTLLSGSLVVLSIYLARTFDEVKRRPTYIISQTE